LSGLVKALKKLRKGDARGKSGSRNNAKELPFVCAFCPALGTGTFASGARQKQSRPSACVAPALCGLQQSRRCHLPHHMHMLFFTF